MSTPARARIIDLDVTRAIALIGVVLMNYWGYLILDGSHEGTSFVSRVFGPWTGPLATRFAAVFVMVAGMGITLMTERSRRSGDRIARSNDRWTLIRRGVLLYAFGYAFNWIWDGTILFFYGAFFLVGALLFTLRGRWLALVGAGAATSAALLQWWKFEREAHGHSTAWLFAPTGHSPRGLIFDTFLNGTHPLLPWLAFLCVGIILGRMLPLRPEVRIILALSGLMLAVFAHVVHGAIATTPLLAIELGDGPYSRSLDYTIGTIGSSVAAFCIIGAIAEATKHSRITKGLAAAGRTTLTIYVLHALVYNLLVHDLAWIRPTGLDTAWLLAGGFWVVAIITAAAWQQRFGMGPLERLYRRFGGDPHPGTGSRPDGARPSGDDARQTGAGNGHVGDVAPAVHSETPTAAKVPAH